jgi:GNAT superfamily N-acetyltransferase
MITLKESIDIKEYKPVLEGLVSDFGYVFYHAILSYCEIIDEKWSDNKYWQVRLIKNDNDVIGICGLYSLRENDNSELWLGWFGIIPEFRNQKIGESVLGELETLAKSVGCNTIFSYVNIDGKPLKFYYRNGFTRVSTVGEYLKENNFEFDINEFENMEDHVIKKVLI